ncbi:cytochrome c oxidase assembly protein [Microvirga guangxiensis]|uniref:Putative membrane protein n=1 Tax=Microvirga guangxiensis TaxID=549386 RepID=A0A1G5J065_9HYPH|nr:cytochrome c oxidase assembly protein [Microvirga guangxiensis]SCY81755.1 putative membrane protein [Microvirga guangxiensis]
MVDAIFLSAEPRMSATPYIPYCGSPPVPGQLTWNTDPALIAIMSGVIALYALGRRKQERPDRYRQSCFYVGWILVAAALISPLCNLSVALFSARVTQHMVLTLIAAPLVVLGRPGEVLLRLLPNRAPANISLQSGALPAIATVSFAISLWVWHLPGPYDLTLQSDLAYWAMHLTIFGTALLLWYALFERLGCISIALLVGFGTTVQMSLLSALLTSAPRPLFSSHFGTTWPWGLSPVEDQQLGGLIMWVPGGTLFTVIGVVAFGAWLRALSVQADGTKLYKP